MCHKPLHSLINFAGYLAAPINGADDPKSEKEKDILSAIVKYSKKGENICPGAEVGTHTKTTKD